MLVSLYATEHLPDEYSYRHLHEYAQHIQRSEARLLTDNAKITMSSANKHSCLKF